MIICLTRLLMVIGALNQMFPWLCHSLVGYNKCTLNSISCGNVCIGCIILYCKWPCMSSFKKHSTQHPIHRSNPTLAGHCFNNGKFEILIYRKYFAQYYLPILIKTFWFHAFMTVLRLHAARQLFPALHSVKSRRDFWTTAEIQPRAATQIG